MPTFYIWNSNCSLLVYKKTIDFCVLTLYFVIKLYSLITASRVFYSSSSCSFSSSSFFYSLLFPFSFFFFFFFLMMTLWDFLQTGMCSVNNKLHLFFSTCIPFISFSYLIVLARTSKTMLNRTCERGYPCLVPDLRKHPASHD